MDKMCRCGHWLSQHDDEGHYDDTQGWVRECAECGCSRFVWGA